MQPLLLNSCATKTFLIVSIWVRVSGFRLKAVSLCANTSYQPVISAAVTLIMNINTMPSRNGSRMNLIK